MRDLHVRIEDEVYDAVLTLAARRGESANRVLRRLVQQGVAGDAAADGRAVVARAVRPVIQEEMNAWRHLMFRTALDTAVSGQLMAWWLQDYLATTHRADEITAVIANARKRGAERLRRDAEKELLTLWPEEADFDY